ncbi:MAG: AMP-dependent synthetase [Gammaproteobacteria bacterium]|nr:AMP-dependent synthetase [Gammaproteobacteria bacterium]
MNLVDPLKKWSELTPDTEAIIDIDRDIRISFRDLLKRSLSVASGLSEMGLKKGDRVAILSSNRIEFFEIYYACAIAGFIAQPINWRLAPAEISRILEDGKPLVLICEDQFLDVQKKIKTIARLPITYLELGHSSDQTYENLALGNENPENTYEVYADDPVLILYTGGTTGLSKGALHTHHSLYMGMINQTVAERIVPTDVYMLTGQMFHIPVALAMNYLAHGCPCVLINFEAEKALKAIEQEKVSAFLGITTMLNWMMASENFENYDLSSLRNIQYGGGPMAASVVKAALDSFPCTLIQGYGQTEGMTMTFLSQEDHDNAIKGKNKQRLNSCGREGFVTRLKVADPDGNPVPKDGKASGEIVIKSEANMLGYWQKPDLTKEIIKDGWMWTGDIATWDDEGYVYIIDRAKDMIISGGENIYSTQVEAAIYNHPGVLECAVIGVPDEEWGESVKAVVVMKPGEISSEQEIIDIARESLASYQKPKSVDFLDTLPKAPTGKILKRELRAPYWDSRSKNV